MISTEPNYIIAIGASAGGMEEINSFFDHTPLDGVSYVIIQHLSADFKSRMVELLARHSKLEVKEAEDAMPVKSNIVYLIPNDKYMTIKGGHLLLTKKEDVKGPHLTIDKFFTSLAADCGSKAIGIILSGLGSDGTEGIKAIKKRNGMVMVRNPETSEFSSMPAHAIATGVVDHVLEPELMPGAIESYVKTEEEFLTESNDDDKTITAIVDLISQKTPLDFSDYKHSTILRRTKRRAVNGNFASLKAYYEYLKETPQELTELSKEFLISVTSFFRDPDAFEFVNTTIIPDLLGKLSPGEELKIWVAGCATGEEVYTLAILVAGHLTGDYKDTIVKIFATDIDAVAMEHAGKGVYQPGVVKNIPAALLDKYFLKENNQYRVKPIIRKMVIFAHHDLVKNPPYCNMHLISCRNLLIYLTPVLQKKIFSMLLFGLRMDGYLFLGSSESPMPIIANLEVINKKWKIYKNVKAKRAVSFDAFSMPEILNVMHQPASFLQGEPIKNISNSMADVMYIELAKEFNCLVVCIDEHNQVIKSYGDTGKYLLQENFNSNLAELLPGSLAIAFNTLVSDSRKTNKRTGVAGVLVENGAWVMKVDLAVIPLQHKKGSQNISMVVFTSESADTQKHKKPLFDEKIYLDKYTKNLEEELKDLKDTLHITYEQLDASNENMQSFNEELISANEEMQSTNEEMQSVNEELHTINADYQLKNKELLEMNDDLNNYFRSNINGQLFINNDLLLMKFSPGAVKQINLVETDIGRPLHHISTNIKFETIIHDVKQVLKSGNLISKEIETNNGKWYQMMIMPYLKQADGKINGAIITFNDVTALKQTQTELDRKNQSLVKINADLDHFIYAASHDLLAPLGNIEASIDLINHIALADDKLVDFLNIIHKSVKTFRSLIIDIADIAKVEADMIKMEWVKMDDLINNIEWSLEDKIKVSGATIIRDFDIKEIMFSKKNLRSIVFNLVSNAIKFKGEENPVINIKTLMTGDYILLSVQDNGRGIADRELERIFDIYGRLHQDIEGSGIGLYLAKKIINAAGGNIKVESELGKGSKFTITLNSNVL